MEVLVLDGKNYVKASKAARDLGYASDYVGQLCRSGQVDAHLIGRTWYVNQEELGTHRFEKKRMSRVKAREQAKKTIEEHRLKVMSGNRNNYRNIDIRYESDDEELIPETRKIEVRSSGVHQVEEDLDYDSTTKILNKGEKLRMSGDLKVVDVTDGPVETDTTILRPGRIRSGTVTVDSRKISASSKSDESGSLNDELLPLSFTERLGINKTPAGYSNLTDSKEVSSESELTQVTQGIRIGLPIYSIISILCVLGLVLLTLPLFKIVSYVPGSQEFIIAYQFSIDEIISIISLKI